MTRFVPLERSTLYSPAWFVPFDDYARRVRTFGVTVELDRWVAGDWVPQDVAAVRTPSAAFVYPGLGRRGDPASAEPDRYRARLAATGYQPLYPADDQLFSADLVGVEFVVHPYNDSRPPTMLTEPRLVRMLPNVAFPYGLGIRTVYGVVVDATTHAPVANALVEARGTTTPDGVAWFERTLSDPRGAFRLSLRWEGQPVNGGQQFTLTATERPDRTGSLDIQLPRDRDRRQVIEIVQQ
jgi:hypothetical protein